MGSTHYYRLRRLLRWAACTTLGPICYAAMLLSQGSKVFFLFRRTEGRLSLYTAQLAYYVPRAGLSITGYQCECSSLNPTIAILDVGWDEKAQFYPTSNNLSAIVGSEQSSGLLKIYTDNFKSQIYGSGQRTQDKFQSLLISTFA